MMEIKGIIKNARCKFGESSIVNAAGIGAISSNIIGSVLALFFVIANKPMTNKNKSTIPIKP